MSLWRWSEGLDAPNPAARLTLGEGDTPLVRSRRLGPEFGLCELHFKLDQCNPTGSYMDRFACCAVSHMVAAGQRRCVATTSGNTGSALAAYCAAAGIRCYIAVVETAPSGKLQQMLAYGADIFRVKQFGIDPQVSLQVFQLLDRLGKEPDAAVQISAFKYSPRGMSGVRTLSYELAEQLSGRIDHIFTQAGGGGADLGHGDGLRVAGRTRTDAPLSQGRVRAARWQQYDRRSASRRSRPRSGHRMHFQDQWFAGGERDRRPRCLAGVPPYGWNGASG